MWLITAIAPVVIVGGIVVFVIKRLEHKYKNGKLGKKKSQKLNCYYIVSYLWECLSAV